MSKKKENASIVDSIEEVVNDNSVEEVVNDTPVIEEKTPVYIGKIRDCDKLNVREKPTLEAKVICKLDKMSEVQIDKSNSTKEFYKILTSKGVTGYCMKKYMSVNKQEV